jgi:hypothetical protein
VADWQRPSDVPVLRHPAVVVYWRAAYERDGTAGLINKKPCAHSHPKTTAPAIVEQILHLRRTYHLGPIRIVWYLERYHGIRVCDATVYRTLKRQGMNRLPNRVGRRAVHTHRYAKQVPGHHVQVDVKFLTLQGAAQRIRLPVHGDRRCHAGAGPQGLRRHTQQNAIAFVDYVVGSFPSSSTPCALTAAMSSGCSWHLARSGDQHATSSPARHSSTAGRALTPHRQQESISPELHRRRGLAQRLAEWEDFYNTIVRTAPLPGRRLTRRYANGYSDHGQCPTGVRHTARCAAARPRASALPRIS